MEAVYSNLMCMIAAVDQDRGYSANGVIPWNHPEDLAWFKQQTDGQICIMGRVTYEDICRRLGDKSLESVLPNRKCFVVSSTLTTLPNATVVAELAGVAAHLGPDDATKQQFIIGGGRLFVEGIATVQHVFLTVVNDRHGCDRFFPVEYLERHFFVTSVTKAPTDESLRFVTYTRKS